MKQNTANRTKSSRERSRSTTEVPIANATVAARSEGRLPVRFTVGASIT